MYAIIKSGGKQHRLGIGDSVKVEKLPGSKGDVIELPEVLMIADGDDVKIGTPTLPESSVKAEIVGHGRDKKIRVFKMKRRKKYRRTLGHRQAFTQLKITEISG